MNSKLKEYRFPKIRLDILLTELRKLYEKNDGNVFTKEKMIEDIGASRTSSSIGAKIFELKNFGLLEEVHQNLHITELGRKIFQVADAQRSIEIEKAIKNIKLWNVIQNLGGNAFSGPELTAILVKSGELSEQEVKQMLPEIRDAFLRDTNCIKQFRPTSTPVIQVIKTGTGAPLISAPPPSIAIQKTSGSPINDEIKMSIQYGTHQIDIVDELTFNFAEQMMRSIRKELVKRGVQFDTI